MSKKLLSALLTILMLVSMLPVSAFAAEGEQESFTFSAPELRVLTEDETIGNQSFKAGMIVLVNIPDSLPYFTVEIKETGSTAEPFEFYTDGFGGEMRSAQEIYIGWYVDGVLETGSYDVSVYYSDPDGDVRVPLSPTTTIPYNYISPGQQYGTPTDVAWTEDNDFRWTLPGNVGEDFHLFVRFGKKQENGDIQVIGSRTVRAGQGTERILERFNERVNRYGEGDYCFSVRVLSDDITQIWHSNWSDWSETRHIVSAGDLKDGIDRITDGLPEGELTEENRDAAVEAVRELDANSLASSMAADNTGAGVTASLAQLEAKLGLTATVEKNADAGIDVAAEKISVVGAGFNSKDKATAPTLTISKAPDNLVLPVEGYVNANAIQVDLSLGEDVEKKEDGSLLVPVRITLPVPGNLDPQRLRILHFGGEGHYDRAIVPYVYEDNGTWMASFVVTHLSPFAFIETAPQGPEDPEDPEPSAPFTVTFAANGGAALDPGAAETDAEGKLASLPVPTRSGYDFAGWYTEADGGDKVTAETVFNADSTIYAHWTKQSSGDSGSGGSASSAYAPEIKQPAEGGTVTVSPSKPKRGDSVTIKPVPEEGYEVEKITVTDQNGRPVTVTAQPDGTYSFTQPSSRVKIEVTYKLTETPWSNPFTDVSEGAWYYGAVRFVSENGLMGGYGNGAFGSNDKLSRAQLAQIIYNREGKPAVTGSNTFTDAASGAWYADVVTWAAEQGIVSGYGNGMFGPNDNITREQLAVMLWRYAGGPAATKEELEFADAGKISDYAMDALKWAVEQGIMQGKGDGIFDPNGNSTRAEVAATLQRFCENIAK